MKSYVIRLKDIDTSELLAEECINSGKRFGLNIEKFDGIYGKESIEYYTTALNVHPWKEKFKKGRLGVKGCFLSHYTLWTKCLELNEPICIFEHDAIVLDSFPFDIENTFNDFLLLDPYNKFSSEYVNLHKSSRSNEQKITTYFNPNSRKKYGIDSEYAMGLQGYIIKPSAALKLKESIKETGYYPADMQCNKSILNLETVSKPLVSINPKYYNNVKLMSSESSTQYKW